MQHNGIGTDKRRLADMNISNYDNTCVKNRSGPDNRVTAFVTSLTKRDIVIEGGPPIPYFNIMTNNVTDRRGC